MGVSKEFEGREESIRPKIESGYQLKPFSKSKWNFIGDLIQQKTM